MSEEPVQAEVPDYDSAPGIMPPGEGGGEGWHPDVARVKSEALYGRTIGIEEVDYRDSAYQPGTQYALILFSPLDKAVKGEVLDDDGDPTPTKVEVGQRATALIGSQRAVDQLRKTETFPVRAQVGRHTTQNNRQVLEFQPA